METKPWYSSKTIWGAVIVLVTTALRAAGIEIGDKQEAIVTEIANVVGIVMVIAGRFTARTVLTTREGAGVRLFLLTLVCSLVAFAFSSCAGYGYGLSYSDGKRTISGNITLPKGRAGFPARQADKNVRPPISPVSREFADPNFPALRSR